MVAGRAGAAMAAEIGTMRVTDQVDALTTLSTDPMKYLVAPRLLAGLVALPSSVVIADILGVLGGFIVGVMKLGFNPGHRTCNDARLPPAAEDVVSGLAKAAAFGFLIALMSCSTATTARAVPRGSGGATTSAVVAASASSPWLSTTF
jgi:phospholipid/cholesterol/gamma-HCH transport system permease protein